VPLSSSNLKKQEYQIKLKYGLVLIFSALLAILVYQGINQNKIDELASIQEHSLFTGANLFTQELGSIKDLLSVLSKNQTFARPEPTELPPQTLSPESLQQIQRYFIQFGKASPKIAQIRWIDGNGQEVVRVNFDATGAKITQQPNLQNKASRYYFQQGMQVAAPNVYFSPIDLNVERGAVVMPIEPTIRATIQTSDDEHLLAGLLVINYRLGDLLNTIRQLSVPEAQMHIVNYQGYWLLHAQVEKEWGFMLDKPQMNLKNELPIFWRYQQQHPTLGSQAIKQQLYSFVHVSTFVGNDADPSVNNLLFYAKSDRHFLSDATFLAGLASLSIFFSFAFAGIYIVWRGQRYQGQLIQLSRKLQAEEQALRQANTSLTEHIARQHLLQDELVEAKKLSSLGLMVAGVAHELNTPIGGAIMSLSNADNANKQLKKSMVEGLTKQQFSDSVESINENLQLVSVNLNRAVNLIKQFKRLAIDRVNEDYVHCSLNNIIADVVTSLQAHIKQRKITLLLEIEANLELVSRPGIISQVLENLVMNSLNHGFPTDQKGEIKITASQLDQHQVYLQVADNGVGIPKDMQASIFEPFMTSGRSKGNTGLGLYMVNQWVTKLLAGSIRFTSEQRPDTQVVTEFTLILPTDALHHDGVDNLNTPQQDPQNKPSTVKP
jgi:signal transduction histidine kinase